MRQRQSDELDEQAEAKGQVKRRAKGGEALAILKS